MYLRSVEIENYRAIGHGSVTFGKTTVLFGENDCGRTSIMEALLLILGSPEENFETRLRPIHFHRGPGGISGPLRIKLRIGEDAAASLVLPACMEPLFPTDPRRRREFHFEFSAVLNPKTESVEHSWRISAPGRQAFLDDSIEVLHWLRELVPVLWLRPGLLTASEADPAKPDSLAAEDAAIAALIRHHRNLVTGDTPDLAVELEAGAKAARDILKRYGSVFAGAAPLMSAMASDILSRRQVSVTSSENQGGNVAQKLGVLLLLAAVLQLLRRRPSAQASPVLILENPESNLHPMTLAALRRIIERLLWQKIVTTNSGSILANAPLDSLRRLTRTRGQVLEWSIQPRQLSKDALRRVSYHLRSRRATAMFARCWLLVEGETEFWVLPELARVCGFDFDAEGVSCVEFAQCGLSPLTRLAGQLGIAWHVLVDGDEAGQRYADSAVREASLRSSTNSRVTRLEEKDIEHCFWHNGFADVIQRAAGARSAERGDSASAAIRKAIDRSSKPFLALRLIDAAAERGAQSIPSVLRGIIESSIALARTPPAR